MRSGCSLPGTLLVLVLVLPPPPPLLLPLTGGGGWRCMMQPRLRPLRRDRDPCVFRETPSHPRDTPGGEGRRAVC
jgi:hypothetical protein